MFDLRLIFRSNLFQYFEVWRKCVLLLNYQRNMLRDHFHNFITCPLVPYFVQLRQNSNTLTQHGEE